MGSSLPGPGRYSQGLEYAADILKLARVHWKRTEVTQFERLFNSLVDKIPTKVGKGFTLQTVTDDIDRVTRQLVPGLLESCAEQPVDPSQHMIDEGVPPA